MRNKTSFLFCFVLFFSLSFKSHFLFADWLIHTGKGLKLSHKESETKESGEIVNYKPCHLAMESCHEKVYRFKEEEVLELFEKAQKKAEEKAYEKIGLSGASSLGLLASSPYVKILASTFVFFSGYESFQFMSYPEALDELYRRQKKHLRQCGHLTYDFLTKAQALGVEFVFTQTNFSLEKSSTFLNFLDHLETLKNKDSKVYKRARDSKVSLREAYETYASENCGFPPFFTQEKVYDSYSDAHSYGLPPLFVSSLESGLKKEEYILSTKEKVFVDEMKENFYVNVVFLSSSHSKQEKLPFLKAFEEFLKEDPKRQKALSKAKEVIVHYETSLEHKKYKVQFIGGELYVHLYPGFRQEVSKLSIGVKEYADLGLPYFSWGFDENLVKAIEDLF